MMARIVLYLLLAGAALLPAAVKAERISLRKGGNVGVTDVEAVRRGQDMSVRFTLTPSGRVVRSNYKLVFQPSLVDGADSLALDPVSMYGRMRLRREKQERLLKKVDAPMTGIVSRGMPSVYHTRVPYADWMSGASLRLTVYTAGCCRALPESNETIGQPQAAETAVPQFKVANVPLRVGETAKKWDFGTDELIIDYRVSSIEIDTTLYSNRQTLALIMDAVARISSDPALSINVIDIVGFASPEGTLKHNIWLGEGRAAALKAYILGHNSTLTDASFKLTNGIENWSGLREMAAASDMKWRGEILSFIDSTPLVDPVTGVTKNEKLKKLYGGEPYRYMLQNFYPHLRNACYISIYYDIVADSEADVINDAAALIRSGQYGLAVGRLEEISYDPRSWNALGVCYFMLGDRQKAIEWLNKAAGSGDENAVENLKMLPADQ